MVLLVAAGLNGCGPGPSASATPGTTPQPTSAATAIPTAQPGGLLTAEQLCAAFAGLAVGALGGPVDEPRFGDVVPRPNGVYCRYQLTGNANTNVEVQLRQMALSEAQSLAQTLGAETAVAGLGDLAFLRESSSLGGAGATLVAWSHDVGLTVSLNREGAEQAVLSSAVEAIARVVLGSP